MAPKTPTPPKSRAARKPRARKVNELAHDDAAATAAGVVLSVRQARFVEEYAIDGNGAAAARRAGYSVRCAKEAAYELLKRPEIQTAARAALAEMTQRAQFAREAVLRELTFVGMSNLRDIVDIRPATKGNRGGIFLKRGADIPPEAWPAIAELSESEDGRIRIKLHNKIPALDFLGRRLKMWEGSGATSVNLTVRLVRELAENARPASAPRRVG